MKNATTDDKDKTKTRQLQEIKKHITTYSDLAYSHVHSGNDQAFISETDFVEKVLDTYDPELVMWVLETLSGTQHEISKKHDTHVRIVRLLHRLREGADTRLITWAESRDGMEYTKPQPSQQMAPESKLEDEIFVFIMNNGLHKQQDGNEFTLHIDTILKICELSDVATIGYIQLKIDSIKQLVSYSKSKNPELTNEAYSSYRNTELCRICVRFRIGRYVCLSNECIDAIFMSTNNTVDMRPRTHKPLHQADQRPQGLFRRPW